MKVDMGWQEWRMRNMGRLEVSGEAFVNPIDKRFLYIYA